MHGSINIHIYIYMNIHTDTPGKRHTYVCMLVNEDRVCFSFAIYSQIYMIIINRLLLMALISSIFRSEEIISQKNFSTYERE